MTDDLTERVARAIYNLFVYDEPTGVKPRWVERGNSLKQDEARRMARAAILETLRGIREPKKEMILAGEDALDDFEDETFSSNCDGERNYYTYRSPGWERGVWQAMLDHLINQYEEQDGQA